MFIQMLEFAVNDLATSVFSEKVEITGNSYSTRDFIPISDLCEFINWSINGLTPKMNFSILNVTSGKATTIGELGEIIKKSYATICKKPITIKENHIKSFPVDPMIYPNQKKKLGFEISGKYTQ